MTSASFLVFWVYPYIETPHMAYTKPLPSLEVLQDIFRLNPGGVLIRRATRRPTGTHKKKASDRYPDKITSLGVTVQGERIAYHRVVWKMHHGTEPPAVIDHIDRDATNNDPGNLREATHLENSTNTEVFKSGVQELKAGFRPRVTVDGKRYALGVFPTFEMAAAVRAAVLAAFPASS